MAVAKTSSAVKLQPLPVGRFNTDNLPVNRGASGIRGSEVKVRMWLSSARRLLFHCLMPMRYSDN